MQFVCCKNQNREILYCPNKYCHVSRSITPAYNGQGSENKQNGVIRLNKPLILVSSVTYAMKGRDLLNRSGFRSYIERIRRSSDTGCGYGIYVPIGTDQAEELLRSEGFRILGRRERGGGL